MKMTSFLASFALIFSAYANERAGFATSTHGEGLPLEIGVHPLAQEYRQQYISDQRIESYERFDLEFFRGNSKGIAMVKSTNAKEMAFVNIMKGTQVITTWKNGISFISTLEEYTKKYGCIPKLTNVSHGWRSEEDIGEVHGLSGSKGYNGIFSTEKHRPQGLKQIGSRTLETDLKAAVQSGRVKFCESCLVQIYACNVSTEFADVFAQISGCQTVLSTAQASPFFQKMETPEDRQLTLNAFHYWLSSAALWAERGRAGWYRATPIKDQRGQFMELIKENLGELYIAL